MQIIFISSRYENDRDRVSDVQANNKLLTHATKWLAFLFFARHY